MIVVVSHSLPPQRREQVAPENAVRRLGGRLDSVIRKLRDDGARRQGTEKYITTGAVQVKLWPKRLGATLPCLQALYVVRQIRNSLLGFGVAEFVQGLKQRSPDRHFTRTV